ncbi:hypothetical protein HDU96_002747 [Phlyctochytrium bullatum]|nr:hypothetical protein HDU96_002747 [Phlyctochytrium bullatum]
MAQDDASPFNNHMRRAFETFTPAINQPARGSQPPMPFCSNVDKNQAIVNSLSLLTITSLSTATQSYPNFAFQLEPDEEEEPYAWPSAALATAAEGMPIEGNISTKIEHLVKEKVCRASTTSSSKSKSKHRTDMDTSRGDERQCANCGCQDTPRFLSFCVSTSDDVKLAQGP